MRTIDQCTDGNCTIENQENGPVNNSNTISNGTYYFYQDGCQSCEDVSKSKVLDNIPNLTRQNAGLNRDLISQFRLVATPTILVYQNGAEVSRIETASEIISTYTNPQDVSTDVNEITESRSSLPIFVVAGLIIFMFTKKR